jgi:pimeloyl-ACP methyl ester carboxylesterase
MRGRQVRVSAIVAGGLALAVLVGHDGSLGWQIVRVVAVLAITAGVLALDGRGERVGGYAGIAFGVALVCIGGGFLPHLFKGGSLLLTIAALVAVAAGAVILVATTARVLRGHRLVFRIAGALALVVATAVIGWVVVPAVMATNAPRPEIGASPASVDLAYESVPLRTSDGVQLAGWYVASTNGAAVVLLHGSGSTRSDVLDQAAVLARHGFGVLLLDARGHGESDGRSMEFGWYGDRDIEAATCFLAEQPDIEEGRIGAVGMSMGGEEAIGAAATNRALRAVVAEGATGRFGGDHSWLSEEYGVRGTVQEWLNSVRDPLTDLLTAASRPTSLRTAVSRADGTRFLLITAGNVADEAHAAEHIASAAPERVTQWTVPGADHTDGLDAQPQEWEQRVTDFLTAALR